MEFKTSYSGATFQIDGKLLTKRCRNLLGSGVMQVAHSNGINQIFKTPSVHSIGEDYIIMDYLPGAMPLPNYLELCTQYEANAVAKMIFNYINRNNHGKKIAISQTVIASKINHIITRLHDYNDISLANELKNAFGNDDIEVASGSYHGDLTFNNILIDGDHPFLIDFLPGYAPTHWLDIVKLQQEVELQWSSYFLDTNKNYYYMLRQLKPYVDSFYDGRPVLRLLEALNYLRILPYAGKDTGIAEVLRHEIRDILK